MPSAPSLGSQGRDTGPVVEEEESKGGSRLRLVQPGRGTSMLSVLKVPPWVTKAWLDSGDEEEGARAVILKASLPAVLDAASPYVPG